MCPINFKPEPSGELMILRPISNLPTPFGKLKPALINKGNYFVTLIISEHTHFFTNKVNKREIVRGVYAGSHAL